MKLSPITFDGVDTERPTVIAGPCSAETEEQVLETARRLAAHNVRLFRAGVWKPRTKPGGFEGSGRPCLEWLKRAKREYGMYTAVEVANAAHVHDALEAGIDILWIGARTSANPFAVQDIADALAGKDAAVLVKNPVNPDLELWIGALERINNAGIERLGAVHRGFSEYGMSLYRNAPQWSIPIELHRRIPELPIFCDPSHMGGRRELIAPLSQEAMDLGLDGLMIETHCEPDRAWSDRNQQITPETLASIIENLVIRDVVQTTENLAGLRREIDIIDNELLNLLAKRMRVCHEIGLYKKERNMPVLQAQRYDEILNRRSAQAVEIGLNPEFVKSVLRILHEEAVNAQMKLFNDPEQR